MRTNPFLTNELDDGGRDCDRHWVVLLRTTTADVRKKHQLVASAIKRLDDARSRGKRIGTHNCRSVKQ